jgi:hypothetical protein
MMAQLARLLQPGPDSEPSKNPGRYLNAPDVPLCYLSLMSIKFPISMMVR